MKKSKKDDSSDEYFGKKSLSKLSVLQSTYSCVTFGLVGVTHFPFFAFNRNNLQGNL